MAEVRVYNDRGRKLGRAIALQLLHTLATQGDTEAVTGRRIRLTVSSDASPGAERRREPQPPSINISLVSPDDLRFTWFLIKYPCVIGRSLCLAKTMPRGKSSGVWWLPGYRTTLVQGLPLSVGHTLGAPCRDAAEWIIYDL
ncbi:hypothetical protein CBL_08025 [Carabus blaptoides fortunei]